MGESSNVEDKTLEQLEEAWDSAWDALIWIVMLLERLLGVFMLPLVILTTRNLRRPEMSHKDILSYQGINEKLQEIKSEYPDICDVLIDFDAMRSRDYEILINRINALSKEVKELKEARYE